MEHKKFFPFEKKDLTEEGVFTGYASVFGGKPDSWGDIIVKGAFTDTLLKGGKFGLGVSMLYQHETDRPIGVYPELAQNNKGLKVTGKLALGSSDADDVYALLKIGALNALSIGWQLLKEDVNGFVVPASEAMDYDEKKRIRYLKKIDLWEISPVTFPANTRATITDVKDAIESAKNERQLEGALRDAGLSRSAAKYIVSLCKPTLKNLKSEFKNDLRCVLDSLKTVTAEMALTRLVHAVEFDQRDVGVSGKINKEEN